MSSQKKRVILDIDVGSDDAYALLVLLYAEKQNHAKIEGIVCSMGNTTLDNVCKNVVRLLELFQRTDIPVFKGAKDVLVPLDDVQGLIHGSDGFGDLTHETEPDLSIIQRTSAIDGMRNIVVNNPGEITLVCVGPLTNAALAMKVYDDFAPNIKEIFIMGGNYAGVGNATAAAEFNFFMDPEGAYIVLGTAKSPVTIVTWETCLNTNINFGWRFDVLGAVDSPFVKLLNKVESKVFAGKSKSDHWVPPDALLVIPMIFPKEAIERQNTRYATVELQGRKTRGQIVVDHLKRQKPNVVIIEKINEEFVKEILLTAAKTII